MRLMAFVDTDSEEAKPVDALYFDGYHIGERQLEGLPIKIKLNQSGEIMIFADWPKGLDKKYWTDRAKVFAAEYDVFSTSPALDNDDGFIEP